MGLKGPVKKSAGHRFSQGSTLIGPQAQAGSVSCLSGRRTLSVTDTNPVDYDSNQRQLTGAAHVAASWVRARRAAWSESPLEIPPAPSAQTAPVASPRDPPVVLAFGRPDAPG